MNFHQTPHAVKRPLTPCLQPSVETKLKGAVQTTGILKPFTNKCVKNDVIVQDRQRKFVHTKGNFLVMKHQTTF